MQSTNELEIKKYAYSLVIPVLHYESNPWLPDLLNKLSEQSLPPEEVHLVIGDKRQGRAINYGVSRVKTKYVGTVDDDSVIDDSDLFKKIISAMENDDSIGMGGGACEIPDFASSFQKRAMREIKRRYFPSQKKHIDSDMVQHPCLMMKTNFFHKIGGEDEELIRGLDPILRKKVRDHGKRVVVIADTYVYHLLPDSWSKLLKMYFRNGRGSAYAQKHFPDRVLELTEGYDDGAFVEKKPILMRFFRRFITLLHHILKGSILAVGTDVAYAFGIFYERLLPANIQIPEVESIKTESEDKSNYKLFFHRVVLKSSAQ